MKHLKKTTNILRVWMEISIREVLNWIFFAFLSLEKKNQTFGMTDMKSAQQTNSVFKNKNTTVSTQKMEKSESLKFDKFMKCYDLEICFIHIYLKHTANLDLSTNHM